MTHVRMYVSTVSVNVMEVRMYVCMYIRHKVHAHGMYVVVSSEISLGMLNMYIRMRTYVQRITIACSFGTSMMCTKQIPNNL